MALIDRLLAKLVRDQVGTGCWEWMGGTNGVGYGKIWNQDALTKQYVHRVAWTILVGPIPEGLQLDHLCRNRACCNPAHLEPVTQTENIRRGSAAEASARLNLSKTHCPKGHPYSGDNLYVPKAGNRMCRACGRERTKARYWARKAIQRQSDP